MFRFVLIAAFLSTLTSGQQIQFQGVDTNQNRQPTSHDRKPIESDKCNPDEFLYPGDNEKDWVCDCKPTYVYYPADSKCYQVYSKGPCKQGHILILKPKKAVPECHPNPCSEGQVKFRNLCGKLNTNEACPIKDVVLKINATTLEPTCALNLDSRFGDEDTVVIPPKEENPNFCYLGSKRKQNETCPLLQ